MRKKISALALVLLSTFHAAPLMADAGGALLTGVQQGRFAVMAGSSLRTTLEGWSRSSGWTIIWDQEFDYQIRATAVFPGDFESAVVGLVDSIHLDNPELSVVLYRGNSVLHVENRYSTGD